MSLRLRLTLTYSLLLALALALAGVVLYSTMRRDLEQEMDKRLRVRASQVELSIFPDALGLNPNSITAANLDLSPLSELDAPGIYVQVLDRQGQVVATSSNLRGQALPTSRLALSAISGGGPQLTTVDLGQEHRVRVLTQPLTAQGVAVGALQVGQSRQPLQQTLDELRTLLLILGGGALAVCGVTGWLVAERGLRPIRVMSRRAADITARHAFDERLRVAGAGEVGELSRTVDTLLFTVDGLLRSQRRFLADTSHELRNPLLAIRTNLDLLDRVTTAHERDECIDEARGQVDRMTKLVGELLLLARAESGQLVELRPLALAPLVRRLVQEARQQAAGQEIVLGQVEPVEVLGDEGRLAQVVSNLVTNAVQHTPAAGAIAVSLQHEDGFARLTVADTGDGIHPDDLPHIFERFYQGRPATGRARAGAGLGLAIVEHLVHAHGGYVTAESEPGRGSRFTVWLPAVRMPAPEPAEPVHVGS